MAKQLEPQNLTALVAVDTQTHVEIMCETDDGRAVTLRLPYQRYDEQSRRYVADPDAMQRCEDNLKSIGLSMKTLASDAMGTEFEGYVQDSRATLYKPRVFTRFEPIRGATFNKVRKAIKGQQFDTIPLTEFDGNRFNFGVAIELPDAMDPLNFRISQFSVESADDTGDVLISARYADRKIQNFEQALEDSAGSEEVRERASAKLKEMKDAARTAKLKELSTALGVDVAKLLDDDSTFKVILDLKRIATSREPVGFLVAEIVPESITDDIRYTGEDEAASSNDVEDTDNGDWLISAGE